MRIGLVWFLLAACSQEHKFTESHQVAPQFPPPFEIEHTLIPYVDDFEQTSLNENNSTSVYFVLSSILFQDGILENNPSILGVCYYSGEERWVRISSVWWGTLADIFKKYVMFHELGHCTLRRNHYNNQFILNDKEYTSIMASTINLSREQETIDDWAISMKELFNPSQYHKTDLQSVTLIEDECFVTPEGYTACPITADTTFQ